MGRPQRFIPKNKDGVLVEISGRAIGACALLVPAPNPRRFNEMIVGGMGRALEVARGRSRGTDDEAGARIDLRACVWTANHYHILAVVHRQQELSRFMHHLAGNVSKEVNRIRGRRGTLWERRYDQIVVSDEPDAQWKSLKYLLSHGVKEQLCESPLDWPGVHAARSLVHGESLEGFWWNRTREWAARNRGQKVGAYDFATRYLVDFAQLPAFRELSAEQYQDKIADLIREIEEEGRRTRAGNPVAGVEKILSLNPFEPPTRKTKRSAKPHFRAESKQARDDLRSERATFLAQYAIASQALRLDRNPEAANWFPKGCYRPALPFNGPPAPCRPPTPPTRRITVLESGAVERGDIPVVEIRPTVWKSESVVSPTLGEPRARGQPP